ncbi:MFS transporter [Nocardioides humi]|uniref:MFS transporter n=1 Tax=Nocardioides humi TaxID=449461 RepID=UPI00319E7759
MRDELPPRLVPTAISLISSLLAVGFGAGIVVAGPIVEVLGYHWLALLPMLVSVAAALGALLLIPESPVRTREHIPVLPAALLAGWLSALLLGVSRAPHWGWGSWQVLLALALAVLLLVLWVVVEWRQRVPLIDLRLMARRGVWTANLVGLLIGAAMYGALGFYPQFNQTPSAAGYGFGASVTEAGHMLLPAAVMTFLCGVFAAPLAERVGARLLIGAGCLTSALGISFAACVHDARWEMYVAGGITGLGSGLVFACLPNAVVAAVAPHETGVATGVNSNIRTLGGALGSALMTSLLTSHLQPSGYSAELGYELGFLLLACCAGLAVLATLLVPRAAQARQQAWRAVEDAPLVR